MPGSVTEAGPFASVHAVLFCTQGRCHDELNKKRKRASANTSTRTDKWMDVLIACQLPLHSDILPLIVESVNAKDYRWSADCMQWHKNKSKLSDDGRTIQNQGVGSYLGWIGDKAFGTSPVNFDIKVRMPTPGCFVSLGVAKAKSLHKADFVLNDAACSQSILCRNRTGFSAYLDTSPNDTGKITPIAGFIPNTEPAEFVVKFKFDKLGGLFLSVPTSVESGHSDFFTRAVKVVLDNDGRYIPMSQCVPYVGTIDTSDSISEASITTSSDLF